MMKKIFNAAPFALLVLLYVYAATSKLADPEEFRHQLYNQTFPHGLADLLLYGLPGAELMTVALMLVPSMQRYGLLLSFILLILFTGYIGLVKLHFWPRVPCSCGGILSRMSWTTHLIFNCCCILVNVAAFRNQFREVHRAGS